MTPAHNTNSAPTITLMSVLKPYRWLVAALALATVLGNALNLAIPVMIARAIDTYGGASFSITGEVTVFCLVAAGIFALTYAQSILQTYASERVARDLRDRLVAKISQHEYAYIERVTPAKLLTNLTSDIDAVKTFVSQAIASLVSSVFLIIGASALLLWIDWRLALAVLLVLPFIGGTFFFVLSRVRKLFKRSQEAIDWLNKVISESIFGAALIRLLNSQQSEYEKFLAANTEARSIGMSILRLFASLIPIITFATNLATLIIVVVGGAFVIQSGMTIGDFTAFNNYLALLVFPIIVIGFMSNAIAQAQASLARIAEVLDAPVRTDEGVVDAPLRGTIAVRDIVVRYGERSVLKRVSLSVEPKTRTAIIGPTAAGKTQLLYAMTGLLEPAAGEIEYDGVPLSAYRKQALHRQIGFVFQDSIMFNLTLRENIAFSNDVRDEDLEKAIETAELSEFIGKLPEGLDTVVSERGTSLSGGQKQRVMLARALALNPAILLLDDFTARVDTATEKKILGNVAKNYPELTLVSVTQKIAPVEGYDQIVLLMEGEVLAVGTHRELLEKSPEYVQIYNSQKSTENYERV